MLRLLGSVAMLSFILTPLSQARDTPPLTFTVPGNGFTQLSQLNGKVVALAFGYSTCKPCQAAAERLDRITTEFREQGFAAYEIAYDPNAPQLVESLAKQQKLSIPIAWANGEAVMRFLGYGPADRPSVPQIVLLDRAGAIRFQTAAQGTDDLRSDAVLRTHISELIAPAAAPPPEGKAAAPRRSKDRIKER